MKHNVYFGGAVQSLRFEQGPKDTSVGVLTPGDYEFTTSSAEHVEVLAGSVEFGMSGNVQHVPAGGAYDVPAASTFHVRCREHVAYMCDFLPRQSSLDTAESLTIPPILDRTPTLIGALVDGLPHAALEWRPTDQRWSIAMVIAHLAESEVNCFRLRLAEVAASQDGVTLSRYDQWAGFTSERTIPPVELSLERFRLERAATLRWLRTLSTDVRTHRARHEKLGELTFDELLNEFAFHDMGHMRQVLELARSAVYYPAMGVWRNYYQVSP